MNVIIRTTYNTHPASGASRITAKGGGKQRTIQFDPAKSSDRNHGEAAGTLALALGLAWHDGIEHDQSDDGVRHCFRF